MGKARKGEVTNNDLAKMIKQGLDGVDERFGAVDRRFDQIDQRLDRHDERILTIEEAVLLKRPA